MNREHGTPQNSGLAAPRAQAGTQWSPPDYPALVFRSSVLPGPGARFLARLLFEGKPFVDVEVDAENPIVPFSLGGDTDPRPFIEGKLNYQVNSGGVLLIVSNLRYPGGTVAEHVLDSTVPDAAAQPERDEELMKKTSREYVSDAAATSRHRLFKPISGNTPERAPLDTNIAPYWFVGQLLVEFPKAVGVATATLIAAKRKENTGLYLLTCAHNLFNHTYGGRAEVITFQRGLNGQPEPPYPVVQAADWFYPNEWPDYAIGEDILPGSIGPKLLQQSQVYDYGLIRLRSKIDVTDCPMMTARRDDHLQDREAQLIGMYKWNGEEDNMYVGTGKIDVVTDVLLGYKISTDAGTSGTAVMESPITSPPGIVGVHIKAGLPGDNHNYGRRLTQDVIDRIESWQS